VIIGKIMEKSDSWTSGGGSGFGLYEDRDEELHPEHRSAHDSLTETWAYMFWMPRQRIGCIAYLWVHPNLNVITGGLTVYQGHKSHHLQGEIFDVSIFNSVDRCVFENGRDIRMPNGFRAQILDPFKSMHLTYADRSRGNSIDLRFNAACPPIMRENRKHFDQIMDVEGRISLRGKEYALDCWGSRDRSWGEPRPENPYPIPPYTWMTGRFKSGMMWNGGGHDDPARRPDWSRSYRVDPNDAFKDGWVFRGGEALRISDYSKLTKRDPRTRRPLTHDVKFVDQKGRKYHIEGEVIASTPWGGWFNANCFICSTRWRWGKETGYGDTQEVSWGDYIHEYRRG
jgi:hypothetical protein